MTHLLLYYDSLIIFLQQLDGTTLHDMITDEATVSQCLGLFSYDVIISHNES